MGQPSPLEAIAAMVQTAQKQHNHLTGLFTLDQLAEMAHEANRAYQRILQEPVSPPWPELSEEAKESTRIGVRMTVDLKTGEHRRPNMGDLHNSWLATKLRAGWRYAPVRNDERKEHPNLLPYEALGPSQQVKDQLFTHVLFALCSIRVEVPCPDDEQRKQ